MSNRTFEKSTFTAPGGRRKVSAYIIRCGACGTVEKVTSNTHSGCMADEVLARKFRSAGWQVGSKPEKDRCPKCLARTPQHPKEESVKTMPEAAHAEPPRQITKEDRRIVFAKIDENYLDESTGYQPGWTDQRVATDLNVPLDWVRQIREENFGAEGANEEIRQIVVQVRGLIDDSRKVHAQITADIDRYIATLGRKGDTMRASIAPLAAKADELSRDLARIEKALKP